jgi:hypothetical protein
MLSIQQLSLPVLHWLDQRARFINNNDGLEWILRDGCVSHLVPAMYLLDRYGLVELPEHVRSQAYQVFLANRGSRVAREYHLKKILDALNQAGIQVIPLKGGILLSQLYQHSGLRPMSDTDILVKPEAYLSAAQTLLQCGLRLHSSNGFESLTWIETLPESCWPGEIIFYDNHGWIIELHRHLVSTPWFMPAYTVDIEAVWSRSILLTEQDKPLDTDQEQLWKVVLSPYDMLAHLCLHLALHGLIAYKSYLDVDLYIRNLPPDWEWEQFIELVESWQIRSATYHVFTFSHYFMDTPLPDGLLRRLDPGLWARWRLRLLITAESLVSDRPTLGKRYPTLVKLALIDRLSRIVSTLFKLIFPDTAWLKQQYGENSTLLKCFWRHITHVWIVTERGD